MIFKRRALGVSSVKFYPPEFFVPIINDIPPIDSDLWSQRFTGIRWMDIGLVGTKVDPQFVHSNFPKIYNFLYHDLPHLPVSACLSLLRGNSSIPEHRDFAGGTPFGVLRIHIPLITDEKVTFSVNRHRYYLPFGTCWTLDTTYLHSVSNCSNSDRIHLIIDLPLNYYRALLPITPLSLRIFGFLHFTYFFLLATLKALRSILQPQKFRQLFISLSKLLFKKSSPLY